MTIAKLRRAAVAATLGTLAAAAIGGCAASTGPGAGTPVDGAGVLGAAPATDGPSGPTTPPADQDKSPATQGGTPTRKPATTTQSGPQIVYLRVKQKPQCPQGTNQYPVPGVPLILEWKVSGAHQVALSVDNPTMVGSYGTYGTESTETFMFGCGGAPNTLEKHTYTIYTVGGGAQQRKTLTVEAKVYEIGQT